MKRFDSFLRITGAVALIVLCLGAGGYRMIDKWDSNNAWWERVDTPQLNVLDQNGKWWNIRVVNGQVVAVELSAEEAAARK